MAGRRGESQDRKAVSAADSSKIIGISSMATREVLGELAAAFERRSGRVVAFESVGGVDAAKRVGSGEPSTSRPKAPGVPAWRNGIIASDATLSGSSSQLQASKPELAPNDEAASTGRQDAAPSTVMTWVVGPTVPAAVRRWS